MSQPSSDPRREWDVAVVAIEEHLGLENVDLHGLRGEVSVNGESLQTTEREAGAALVLARCIERSEQLCFLRWRQVDEARRSHRCRARVDVFEAGKERRPFFI